MMGWRVDGAQDDASEDGNDDVIEAGGETAGAPSIQSWKSGTRFTGRPPRSYYAQFELTPERRAYIQAHYDGRAASIKTIAEGLGLDLLVIRRWVTHSEYDITPNEAPDGQTEGSAGKRKWRGGAKITITGSAGNLDITPPGSAAIAAAPDICEAEDDERGETTSLITATVQRKAQRELDSDDDDQADDDASPLGQAYWDDALRDVLAERWDGTPESLLAIARTDNMPLATLQELVKRLNVKPRHPAPAVRLSGPSTIQKRTQQPAPVTTATTPVIATPVIAASVTTVTENQQPASASTSAPTPTLTTMLTTTLDAWMAMDPKTRPPFFRVGAYLVAMNWRAQSYHLYSEQCDWPREMLTPAMLRRLLAVLSPTDDGVIRGVIYGSAPESENVA